MASFPNPKSSCWATGSWMWPLPNARVPSRAGFRRPRGRVACRPTWRWKCGDWQCRRRMERTRLASPTNRASAKGAPSSQSTSDPEEGENEVHSDDEHDEGEAGRPQLAPSRPAGAHRVYEEPEPGSSRIRRAG